MKNSVKAFSALEDAADHFGGRKELAKELTKAGAKVSAATVGNWKKVPLKYVRLVSKLTGISHHDLLPDMDWL